MMDPLYPPDPTYLDHILNRIRKYADLLRGMQVHFGEHGYVVVRSEDTRPVALLSLVSCHPREWWQISTRTGRGMHQVPGFSMRTWYTRIPVAEARGVLRFDGPPALSFEGSEK